MTSVDSSQGLDVVRGRVLLLRRVSARNGNYTAQTSLLAEASNKVSA
jgi:hypothetical protein